MVGLADDAPGIAASRLAGGYRCGAASSDALLPTNRRLKRTPRRRWALKHVETGRLLHERPVPEPLPRYASPEDRRDKRALLKDCPNSMKRQPEPSRDPLPPSMFAS